MKLSTKGRYGLKALYFIAKQEEDEPMSVSSLSKLTQITPAYLEKILAILKKYKLVVSSRGANGGYFLSRSASEITIGEILRALEGKLYLADCNAGKCENNCCPNKTIFKFLYDKINEVFDKFTLEDMVRGIYE